MKIRKKHLLFLALVIVSALLLGSVSASAGENPGPGNSLVEARTALEKELLPLAGAGFAGIAHSEADGEVIVFVENEQMRGRVPHSFEGYAVRTEVTGVIEALSTQIAEPMIDVSADRKAEVRPLVGGISLSAFAMKGALIYLHAGTLGIVTYDNKILSNAHVIAMEPGTHEFLHIGTPIIQPGSGDGGRLANRVGVLEAYIPIDFGPHAENYADAAIGSIDAGISASPGKQFEEGGNYWVAGSTVASKGDSVRKSGRTTGVTTGVIIHTNASVWVGYGDQSAYFVDQIVVAQENWSFVARGDSGAAVDKDGEFVGLVFASSATHAVVCKAEHVIDGLGIALESPEDMYSLTISSTPGGSVTTPGEGTSFYVPGTGVSLVAEAKSGYQFVNWTGDVDTIADVNSASTTVTINDSYSITANFELKPGLYILTISSTPGGSVTIPGEGIFVRDAETVIDLIAKPDDLYQFVNWTGDLDTVADVKAASTTITMDDSYSITANFKPVPGLYSLTVSSTPGGSVPSPGEGIFLCMAGTEVELVAAPDEGYQFVNWTGDVDTVADVDAIATTITMDDCYSITANFESLHPDPMAQLTVSSTTGGEVITPGEGTFSYAIGTKVNLVAEADSGYRFTNWSGDIDTIVDANAASTTITMDSSHFVSANFDEIGRRCCAATAAYGTPMTREMKILREFRDEYLLTNLVGKGLAEFYYMVSPSMAEFITEHPSLQPIVRTGLLPAVAMSAIAVDTTAAAKVARVSLVVLVSGVLAASAIIRRSRAPKYA